MVVIFVKKIEMLNALMYSFSSMSHTVQVGSLWDLYGVELTFLDH